MSKNNSPTKINKIASKDKLICEAIKVIKTMFVNKEIAVIFRASAIAKC
jgi:hypothetical protein